ncbi:ABC transporter ATP-binding protein [Longimicrobium terrae]|uniref:Multiple sugar transport system ATP-binding protein n=1 Tax=Longimicrobium terrae TaxID=1639882 RepID=A0A841GQV2_9BACT|nr:sn-glycerol-3-phosphate ABC transporter ATP-binding protein UgpC [Longimicrobium terrae]MBB4635056.1 multiple sugar transport system ATP-binding protein [Longimicrobium terrae]MBB6069450.1 multiple sugar transport system ATP-binding protein [Longimicrobium terrae]NNC31747.1 sn-glycerol-3-phosphate ABC transporter ATP-binding protein UgpC [Longimicrobium terrae]
MASIQLNGVRKVYREGTQFVAVEGATFTVQGGELMVLVGPSGSGKSTLLRMIAGLESITDGDLHIGDRRVNDVPPRDRDIAMVFQNYALYPHMSVRQNLGFALTLQKRPRPEIEERVRTAAGVLGLDAILDRKPRHLSGGQRQRVALGRAIVRDPAVFLFDEPLSNLDAKLRVQMRAEISALHRRLGATMVYVTHDQVEAMTLGDRIVVLHEGRIQQIGAPLHLYDHPANRFVAGFIGSPAMNFFDGTIERGAEPAFVATGGALRVPLDGEWASRLHPFTGRAVTMGIRPESLYAARGRPADAQFASASFTVEGVEPLGNEIFVHARAGDHRVTSRVVPQPLAAPGEPLELAFDLGRLHFFDPETERSLAPESSMPGGMVTGGLAGEQRI